MGSPLFNAFGGRNNAQNGMQNPIAMVQQFIDFKKGFQGDAKAECEKYMQQLSPDQVNQAKNLANQFQSLLGLFARQK